HGAGLDHSAVSTKFRTEFVSDELGLGHIVVPSTDHEATIAFYRDVLSFHTRGAFPFPPAPGMPPLRIQFMGVNPRHHSFAVMPAPQMGPAIVHIMLEVAEMDQVAQAMERTLEHGFTISSTLGRHTNDKMVSYYLRAPGGWDIEYGYDGLTVDENSYLPQLISADSYWGQQWTGSEPLACTIPLDDATAETVADDLAEPVVENACPGSGRMLGPAPSPAASLRSADAVELPLRDRAGRAGLAHGEDRLGEGLPQSHPDRPERALEGDDDVAGVVDVGHVQRGQGVDAVVAEQRPGAVLRDLHRRRVAAATPEVARVDPALGVPGDDVGRIRRHIAAAVDKTVRQHDHRRGEPVTAQMRALPRRLRVPLGYQRRGASATDGAALVVLAVRADRDQGLVGRCARGAVEGNLRVTVGAVHLPPPQGLLSGQGIGQCPPPTPLSGALTRTADRRHPDILRLGTPSDAAAQFGRENPGRFQQRRMPPRAGELEHEPPHPARPRPLEWIAAAQRGVTARLPVRRPAHSATSTASRNRRRS